MTAKVCSWSSQEGQPDHRPRSHTSFTWLSTPCPQRLQSPSNRPTGPLLTFRPSGGSAGIAATPCWPERQGSTILTKGAFCKKCCTYLCDAKGGQAEVLIGQRTFRVVVGELQPA